MSLVSRVLMADWYSNKCALTWKMKGTKYNRLLFQLVPKTLRTEETDAGSLLPTPTLNNENGRREDFSPSLLMVAKMLPTPRTADAEGGCVNNVQMENGNYFRTNKEGVRWGVKLRDVVESGMLPTPTASDQYSGTPLLSENYPRETDLKHYVSQQIGKTSQLNPRFVAEMMGFPPNWTELPFQNGEQNQLKDMGTL
jgi:hypothetical protein